MNNCKSCKSIFLAVVILLAPVLKAQVNIEFSSVNEYAFNTKEAMNLIVTNGNSKPFNVYFNGKIKDAGGNAVVEFKTHEVVLNQGANVFTPMTLPISEMQYTNTDIAEIEATSGTYPSGNYTICIWMSCVTSDCNGLGQNTISMEDPKCIQVHIENPTPLILATPQNEEEIDETRPLYMWIPPAPVAGSSNLNYSMILVELLEGQSKADALTMNRPLIELDGIINPSLIHPSDLPELEKGKWYAWQVQALVGRTPIAKSEQWKFKVKKDTLDLKKISKNQSYIEISGQTGSSMFYAVGELKLRHVVRMTNGVIPLKILDKKGQLVEFDNSAFTINPGDNRTNLPFANNFKFKHGEKYTLYGNLLNNAPFKIIFTYINPILLDKK